MTDTRSSPKCARCGHEQKEHAYNGACSGLCGEFITPSSPKTTSLLPCPFCGPGQSMVDPWFDDVSKRWAIGCGRCGASSGRSVHAEDSKEAAIKSWNTRGLTPEAPGDVAEVVRLLRARSNNELAMRAADILERLSATTMTQLHGATAWQSIETMPQAGTTIDVYMVLPSGHGARWTCVMWGEMAQRWIGGPPSQDPQGWKATHWMPVPRPPLTSRHSEQQP